MMLPAQRGSGGTIKEPPEKTVPKLSDRKSESKPATPKLSAPPRKSKSQPTTSKLPDQAQEDRAAKSRKWGARTLKWLESLPPDVRAANEREIDDYIKRLDQGIEEYFRGHPELRSSVAKPKKR